MKRQHVLKEELVDVLHGFHLLSLNLETMIQQEVHTTTELVLREILKNWMRVNLFQHVICTHATGTQTLSLLKLQKKTCCLNSRVNTYIPVWQV